MATLSEEIIDVKGVATRVLRGGPKQTVPVLFLHGGTPGVTPYCGGAHLWGEAVLAAFASDRQVIAPDLPGSGRTALSGDKAPTLDAMVAHAVALLDAVGAKQAHVVGHDIGGMIGLVLAMDYPDRLASVSVVASGISAPLGDSLDDILFRNPPEPRWSRPSQAWALDRISYSQQGLDDALLDACEAAASGEPHRTALRLMGNGGYERIFAPSVTKAKFRLWDVARSDGLKVPVQLVWGNQDPTTARDRGAVLFNTLAEKQTAAHFHIVNRAGNLVFRDQPETFHELIAAFQDGVIAEKQRKGAEK